MIERDGIASATQAASHESSGGPGQVQREPGLSTPPSTPRSLPWWMKVLPFFVSAVLFLSAFFFVFSPIPIAALFFRSGRKTAWLAVLTNSILVFVAAGALSLGIYLIAVASLALLISELFLRKKSIEKTAAYSLAMIAILGTVLVAGYSRFHHVNPAAELKQQVSTLVDSLGQQMSQVDSNSANAPQAADLDEWKQSVMTQFPSVIAIFALVLVWVNIVVLLRANPAEVRTKLGLAPDFLKRWKAPEHLIWPTIASGVFLLFDMGRVSVVAVNIFRFLMAIYAIQGISILGFFFEVWGIRGIFRWLGYLIALFLMMPLLLSLGFFDLWFDFRSKFRQS
jgi:hypothetical protein